MQEQTQLQVQIAVLKEQVDNICERLELIEKNHLPHLQQDMQSVKLHLAYYSGGLAVFFVAIELAFKFFLK